jgi:hypothetical protein
MDKRLVVNEALCFVCQERTPTHSITSSNGTHKICGICAVAAQQEIRSREQIINHLADNRIFQMTLGVQHAPKNLGVKIEVLPETQATANAIQDYINACEALGLPITYARAAHRISELSK